MIHVRIMLDSTQSRSVQYLLLMDTCSLSLVWLCSQESLRVWLTSDGPRMSSYPGSTIYALIS